MAVVAGVARISIQADVCLSVRPVRVRELPRGGLPRTGTLDRTLVDMVATDPRVCRRCGKSVTRPIGTGRRRDGVFCGIDCFAIYYARYLASRARHVRGQSHN
jgi:hypothetical protein